MSETFHSELVGADCEYCAYPARFNDSRLVNGYWFHGSCVRRLDVELQTSEGEAYLQLPHKSAVTR